MIDPLLYFWLILKASLFSTGGNGNLPSIHADMLARSWASDSHFAEALAIGQISPGPNGLWVVCFGYLTDGLRGAMLAALAITIPPFFVLAVAALHRRIGDHPAMQGFVRGLGLAVSGIFVVIVLRILRESGIDGRSLAIVVVAMVLGLTNRLPVPLMLGLAAAVGMILY